MIENALKIDGWMSWEELNWLANIAIDCKNIGEVGCLRGRATRALADNCDGIVYAIDPFYEVYFANDDKPLITVGNKIYNIFVANMQDVNNVIILRNELSEVVEQLPKLDFIFLDGDHRYESVKKDIENAKKVVRRGGIIAGHDYTHAHWPGVKRAVDEFFPSIKQIDSIWWVRNE